jgi:hypothetical protein
MCLLLLFISCCHFGGNTGAIISVDLSPLRYDDLLLSLHPRTYNFKTYERDLPRAYHIFRPKPEPRPVQRVSHIPKQAQDANVFACQLAVLWTPDHIKPVFKPPTLLEWFLISRARA